MCVRLNKLIQTTVFLHVSEHNLTLQSGTNKKRSKKSFNPTEIKT